jgi:hypothetical protein
MPELQSCYFCGEIGDALAAFDVVPASLADESTQRTVVVCSTCHRKLDAVIAPLRDLAVERGVDDAGATADDGQADTTDDAGSRPASTDRADGTEDAPSDDPGPLSSDTVESGEITFADAGGESESDDVDDTRGGVAFADADPERADGTEDSLLGGADANVSGEEEGDPGDATEDPDDAGGVGTTDRATTGDSAANGEQRDGSTEDEGPPSDSAGEAPPTGYRKVVRLLQNREFPVERDSFVDLASNAYELAERDVSDSLDRLVERGALVESGGELRKP